MGQLRNRATPSASVTPSKKSTITVIAGATGSSQHSVDEEEKAQFVCHINQVLASGAQWARPEISPAGNAIFVACRDGLVLSKLINESVPDTIDERVLNFGKAGAELNTFQMTENNNVVINSAKAIGCSVVNIGSQDLIEGREHLVLGLIWQVIKIGLLAKINLQFHPELFRLLQADETLEDLLKLPADLLLLRWFNYHLKQAQCGLAVANFAGDIRDSAAYTVLLSQLCPEQCDRAALQEPDLEARAEAVLAGAHRIGCRKYVSARAIVEGNPKLNLAFVANLFNHHPGLAPLSDAEMAALDDRLFSSQGSRDARAFALWMNSLGVEPFVNNIFDDLRDGRVLLQVMDQVRPGCVSWRRVNNKDGLIRFKAIENTNYVVDICKDWKFSLVGIQGADITDGSQTLTLGLVWQLMRENIVATLARLSKTNGREIRDQDIIDWANQMVAKTTGARIGSFKDPSLRSGRFLLDLLAAMRKGIINPELVTPGETQEDAKMNGMYAISVARKMGATIFLLPEDVWEVQPKLLLTFIGSLMAIYRAQQ